MIKNLAGFLFFLAAVLLFWFWTKPTLDELDQLRAQKSAIDKALADSRELQELRDSLLEKYNSVSGESITRLEKMLPNDAEIPKLTVELENIAQRTGVVIKSANATRVKTVAPDLETSEPSIAPDEVNLELVVSSAYEGFSIFLDEIQKSLRLIDVDNIVFSAGDNNFYEFTIKAKAYWIK